MNDKKAYNLVSTIVKGKFNVSVAYRKTSTYIEMWYFVFEMHDVGIDEKTATIKHFEIVEKYLNK
jgi:hypothetical protein